MTKKLLKICCECKAIEMGSNNWISKEQHPRLYTEIVETYQGMPSHSYCPECFENAMKKLREGRRK